MKTICLTLSVLAGLLYVAGFCGALHPFLDAIAIGRWVALFALLAFLSMLAALYRRFVLAGITFVMLISILAYSQMEDTGEAGAIRVYTKNLWYRNTQITALADDIIAAEPDIVILQEVSDDNIALLTVLQSALPHQARCPWQGWNGIAVLSRWPLSDEAPRCSPERSLMAVQVLKPNDAFWAVGVHLQQPWPDVQWDHLNRALPVLGGINDRVIVAGDFNTVPWSAAAKRIGVLTNTSPVPLHTSTFQLWGVGLPLDQIWGLGGLAQRRPLLGSDHHGVVADLRPSNPPKSEN